MDKPHRLQHILVEYGVIILALPDGETFKIQSGYGSMCPWNEKQRLEAYRGIKEMAEKVIEEMEGQA